VNEHADTQKHSGGDTAEKLNSQHRHIWILFKGWSVISDKSLLARGDYRKTDVTETFQAIMWFTITWYSTF